MLYFAECSYVYMSIFGFVVKTHRNVHTVKVNCEGCCIVQVFYGFSISVQFDF